ncbi:MAG: chromate transporter [Dysgonamonadaceae bacterium]|jgi:chromate transporter|nr:chromate transporter [Dysgonamonadaceae bacterium]
MNLYGQLFCTFAKIGTFTIGGGYAMLPLMEKEIVERKHWIEPEEFVDAVAVSQSLPGIFSVNVSIFTGYKLKGYLGSTVAVLGTVLPSFLAILLIAALFRHFNENIYVTKIFNAVRPAAVALIAVPVFTTARHIGVNLKNIVIPVAAAVLIWYWGVSPIYVVLAAAVGAVFREKF